MLSGVFVLVPIVGCDRVAAMIVVTIAAFLNGGCKSGYPISASDIAPIYAGSKLNITHDCRPIPGYLYDFS